MMCCGIFKNKNDELNAAQKNIDDLDEIHEMVTQFEDSYADAKKRINKMEKANQ